MADANGSARKASARVEARKREQESTARAAAAAAERARTAKQLLNRARRGERPTMRVKHSPRRSPVRRRRMRPRRRRAGKSPRRRAGMSPRRRAGMSKLPPRRRARRRRRCAGRSRRQRSAPPHPPSRSRVPGALPPQLLFRRPKPRNLRPSCCRSEVAPVGRLRIDR